MATHTKGSAILFLATFIYGVSGQYNGVSGQYNGGNLISSTGAFASSAAGIIDSASGNLPPIPQKKIGDTMPLRVNFPAAYAIPIQFVAQDYTGPYDPLDPKGLAAAARRQAKLVGQKNMEVAKSYIPPDLGKMVKKVTIQTAINEGRRFAVAHPKEAGEIIAIAGKAKALYDNASRKISALEKEEAANGGRI